MHRPRRRRIADASPMHRRSIGDAVRSSDDIHSDPIWRASKPTVALTARKNFEHQEGTEAVYGFHVSGPGRRYSLSTALAC
eukprot:4987502-Pyramimonas_sp.AAC.1